MTDTLPEHPSVAVTELQNSRLLLHFSSTALLSITDKETAVAYPVSTSACTVVTDRATLGSALRLLVADGSSVTFEEHRDGLALTVTYTLCGELGFFEKRIRLTADDPADLFTVHAATIECITFATSFTRIHLHDDQSLWHCPINYFLETDTGGLALGLCYPYWDIEPATDRTVSLGYTLHYTAGGSLEFEPVFGGVFRKEGIERYSHGPYPGKKPMPYFPGFPDESGLRQHFSGHIIPADAGIAPEVLDWGAVWAMQAYMKYHLPPQPLPEPGWFLWQNGWWAGLTTPNLAAVDVLLDSGVHDLMTAHIAYGHDTHPNTEPRYIRDTLPDPVRFPVLRESREGSFESPSTNALHATAQAAPVDEIVGYTEEFHPPRAYADFIRKAEARGMHIGSFSMPNVAYTCGSDWLSLDEQGRAHEYFHTKLSCPACDAFMAHHLTVTCRILDSQNTRFWAFDGRWQDYRELGGYHFGSIGPDRCHDTHHGHPAGDNRYKEFKNIQAFKAAIRQRYPTLCFEQYYGLKRGSVWMLDHLNADENYYETTGPADNRLQVWHNENDRFRPHYLNYTSLFGEDYASFCDSLISALSAASYAQIARGYHALAADKRCRLFLQKWRAWAHAHIDYLIDRRTLFDCYGFTPLDGSAHIRKDRGFIFLFNASDAPAVARIPLCPWIGLTPSPGTRFALSGLYPDEIFIGTAAYGEELLIELPPHATVLYALTPTTEQIPLPMPAPSLPIVDAFRSYHDHTK